MWSGMQHCVLCVLFPDQDVQVCVCLLLLGGVLVCREDGVHVVGVSAELHQQTAKAYVEGAGNIIDQEVVMSM